ncbi:MAG: GNAT family N-acetyltransferase [Marivita sp.]|uniref:GNAT family N-acetyltransferase n=1 Tax=Marivita sp. TaxID=2003365 RepID=UPI0025B94E2F|nr:GNAT family N-acetyltransferase [Marivita sp.]MCI5111617.1 GNAT family N-acetyltransferase [Marivita sp.]
MRDLTKDDIPDMVPLFRALHRHHVTALPEVFHDDGTDAQFAEHLAQLLDSDGAAVGVWQDGGLVGYALFLIQTRPADVFRHAERRAYLDHLFVGPDHRRAGHAKAMIAAMEDRLAAQGITLWTASHYAFNTGVERTFSAAGARPDLVRVAKPLTGSG